MLEPFKQEHQDELMLLLREFHKEARMYKDEPFDESVVARYFQHCIASSDGFGVVWRSSNGEIAGFIAGLIVPSLFNSGKLSEDLSLYILPAYRKKAGIAVQLVNAYVEWARSCGVKDKFIRISVSAGVDNNSAGNFLERLGFSEVGRSYALGSV